jgi:hypothetical protein
MLCRGQHATNPGEFQAGDLATQAGSTANRRVFAAGLVVGLFGCARAFSIRNDKNPAISSKGFCWEAWR